jgi:hypothetical protein
MERKEDDSPVEQRQSQKESRALRNGTITALVAALGIGSAVQLGILPGPNQLYKTAKYYWSSKGGLGDYRVCTEQGKEYLHLRDRPELRLEIGYDLITDISTWNEWLVKKLQMPSDHGTTLRLSFAIDDYLGPLLPSDSQHPVRRVPVKLIRSQELSDKCVERNYLR